MTPRIAILNCRDQVLSFMDNSQPEAMHYYDDSLHRYLAGNACTFSFKVLSYQDPKEYLQVGNKLSFRHSEEGAFYFNIVTVERDREETEVTAMGLTFELLNEEIAATKLDTAKTFTGYLDHWGFERERLKIGLNEVSDKSIKNEWTGNETVLKRLFSLATVFDAELEFIPFLNDDFSLNKLVMNIYRSDHGMGHDKRDITLRYSDGIEGITKTSDISELITAIRPTGKDGMMLSGYTHAKESDGCYLSNSDIRNPSARDRFPSQVADKDDNYIVGMWSCDVDSKEMLYGRALAELRKKSVPKLSYDIDGYINVSIGDRVTIEDTQFTPKLYVQCRVVEQEISFTDPTKNKTTFDNFTEVQSQLSSSIISQMNALIEKYKQYQCGIASSSGTSFKNGEGETVLQAIVRDGAADKTDDFEIRWFKDGVQISTGKTLTVSSKDFDQTASYRFEAWKNGQLHGQYELTTVNVSDGLDGQADYLHIRWSNDGGVTFTGNNGKDPGDWRGEYHDKSPMDSPDPSDYSWIRVKGEDGADGMTQKLVSLTNEYYLSDSDTERIGGSWDTGYPDYVQGKYLWLRIKAVYETPDAIAYTAPELDKAWLNAGKAIQKAQTAADSASAASSAAAAAVSQAQAAKATADSVAAEIAPIKTGVQEAKDAAADAKKEIADKTQQMLLDIGDTYATKNEVTALEGDLQAQITANATEIASKVSQTEYQQNQQEVDDTLASLNSDLTAAQGTLSSLQSSQSEAAQKLAQAEQDLKDAQDAVLDLQTSQTATGTQLKAAQDAVTKAQAAVDKAQSDVDKANTEIGKVKTDIAGIQGDITDLTSRVTTAETSITQNAEAIALRATKTEVSTAVQGAKDYADAQIKVSANEIKSSVKTVTDKVNGLQQQEVEYFYYLSTSPDTPTGGSWSTTKPAETAGKYIWQKIKTTYVSGASTESAPARLTGKDGKDGINVTVTGTASTYQVSSSGTTVPTGTWSSSIPATNPGQYLWTKNVTTYSNGATSTSYSVSRNGTNGATGPKGETGATGQTGAPGADALHISITPTWSGNSCALTAHVFKGGVELTDTQVIALGALKWYSGDTFVANGKQLTRTVTSR
ncbi:phage tail spike protein, partial [Faecalibaculum rodentium]